MQIKINVNGENKVVDVKPHEYILDTLRGLGYYSVRRGCDTTSCGLCTVLIDGKPILSCSTFSIKCDGHSIITVEGTGDEGRRLAECIVQEGVDQCGYCSPGFILTVLAMKNELTNPTDDEIKHYLNNNLCRCTGYEGQLRAIRKFLEEV